VLGLTTGFTLQKDGAVSWLIRVRLSAATGLTGKLPDKSEKGSSNRRQNLSCLVDLLLLLVGVQFFTLPSLILSRRIGVINRDVIESLFKDALFSVFAALLVFLPVLVYDSHE
jgi:hypothetical protein